MKRIAITLNIFGIVFCTTSCVMNVLQHRYGLACAMIALAFVNGWLLYDNLCRKG